MRLDKNAILNSLTKEDIIAICTSLGNGNYKEDAKGNLCFSTWLCHRGNSANKLIYYENENGGMASYTLLTRELIYTSITRAKKQCHLIAQTGALRLAVSKEGVSVKQTHLQQCLHDIAHPKLDF